MKKNNSPQLATAVLALVLSPVVTAATLYDESVSGDSNGGQLFTLSDSSNTFLGSQTWDDAVDGFRFIIESGKQASIQITYSFSAVPNNEGVAFVWDLWQLPNGSGACSYPPSNPYACTGSIGSYITGEIVESRPGVAVPSSPLGPNLATLMLGSGIYEFNDNFKFKTSLAADGVLTYAINVEQTAVPLPTGAWLFGSAFIGFIGVTRKRR